MNVYSLSFIFMFLPFFGAVFYLAGRRARPAVLFIASTAFCALLSLTDTAVMLAAVSFDFLMSRPIFEGGSGSRKALLCLRVCAAKNILLFVAASSLSQLGVIAAPVGVTVYCFTSLGYLIDLYYGEADIITDPIDYGIFCCFFGKLNVGPIISAGSFVGQLGRLEFSPSRISAGVDWFIRGLAKYVILAGEAGRLEASLRAIADGDRTVLSIWMLVICDLFSVYFTLSGFSDMARGLGAVFGLELPENFHYPLQSDSVTDFFSRFNISANRFVRKYVYSALGAEDNGKLSTTLNIMLITMLMGIWYGIRLNLLIWGASLGVLIVLETLYGEKVFYRLPAALRHLYAFAAVVLSFSWYCGESIRQTLFFQRAMLGLAGLPAVNDTCRWLLSENWLLLVCCLFFCTSLSNLVLHRLRAKLPTLSRFIYTGVSFMLLGLTISFMI